MPLNEDLDIWLDTEEFATIATINGNQYKCIFDTDADVSSFGVELSGIGVEGRRFVACFKSSDVVGLRHGQAIAINAKNYKVIGIQPASEGFTDLELKEV